MKKGVFIVFEGIEGAGKTTQAKNLYEYLNSIGKKSILTREPGGTKTGKKIREILLSDTDEMFPPKAELFLYEADRNFHIHNVIKPNLEKGINVICDRYIYSSLAYQGYARGLDINLIKTLNDIATDGVYPDIVFLIDIPVEVSLQRLGNKKDRIEKEGIDFHKRLRNGFLKIAEENKELFYIIDGTKKEKKIFEEIIYIVKTKILKD
ncbi:MAG TPA: dTMP kinase [Persephonella sp.]|nr:dTMP kinase [Hydrogenothermaceae bacterium]HIQ25384.1 dTMP kinase [Persephonella sp.]